MRNYSDLQERNEIHEYLFNDFLLREKFVYTEKRTACFPSVRTRKGIQSLVLYKNACVYSATTNGNVRESASERKKLIFKFLRKSLGSLKDFECKLSE